MAMQCFCACMQGGGTHAEKSTKKKKKQRTIPHSTKGGRAAQSERAAVERDGAKRADEGPRVAQKKSHSSEEQYQQPRVTTWGKGKGNGGRGGREERPTTGLEGNTPGKRKGAGRGGPELGTRTGLWKAADPVGPRQRVAGGPEKRKKNGMQGKGDGTGQGVWLEPHDVPRRLGRHGRRHRSRGRGREGSNPC